MFRKYIRNFGSHRLTLLFLLHFTLWLGVCFAQLEFVAFIPLTEDPGMDIIRFFFFCYYGLGVADGVLEKY